MTTPTLTRDSFCSYCGTAFPTPIASVAGSHEARYPRTCASCKTTIWANPIPVSVVLVPVEKEGRTGVLVIRRAIQPGLGKLALVGGFLEEHETWQVGGAREVREETGVTIDPKKLTAFWFTSTEPRPNRVLLFSVAAAMSATDLGAFAPDHETSERGLVFGPKGLEESFAFSLHVEAVRRFFLERNIAGAHDYATI